VQTIGQAVDVEAFPFSPRQRSRPLRLLGVGRTSPSKGFDTIVRAVARARASGFDVQLRIIGPSTTPEEERHRVELATLMRDRLGDAGTLDPGVPHAEIASAIAAADVLVSDMVAGSGDKVVFEAAALGRPVIVSNPSFAELLADLPLELRFARGDDAALADVIGSLVAAEDEMIASTVKELRTRVERDHSLDGWADRVASIAGGGV
jgi:glycosyltransferase involved in cell wall biosynthesis